MKKDQGFTLIELVMVIVILGILAATALPKFVSLGSDARKAAISTMAGTLKTTANLVHLKCLETSACDSTKFTVRITMDGTVYWLNYGWPDAGNELGGRQIDALINYDGYTASLLNSSETMFALDGAPDPANCSVIYRDSSSNPNGGITVTPKISGC